MLQELDTPEQKMLHTERRRDFPGIGPCVLEGQDSPRRPHADLSRIRKTGSNRVGDPDFQVRQSFADSVSTLRGITANCAAAGGPAAIELLVSAWRRASQIDMTPPTTRTVAAAQRAQRRTRRGSWFATDGATTSAGEPVTRSGGRSTGSIGPMNR